MFSNNRLKVFTKIINQCERNEITYSFERFGIEVDLVDEPTDCAIVMDIDDSWSIRFMEHEFKANMIIDAIALMVKYHLNKNVLLFDNFKPGVIFKDLSGIMANHDMFGSLIKLSINSLEKTQIKYDKIVGLDARGFTFGGILAYESAKGFVMARKKGKLPGIGNPSARYTTEYSEDEIEIMNGIIKPGEKVLIVDDLIATGGTFEGATKVVNAMGGTVVAYCAILKVDSLFAIAQAKLSKPVIVIL